MTSDVSGRHSEQHTVMCIIILFILTLISVHIKLDYNMYYVLIGTYTYLQYQKFKPAYAHVSVFMIGE
jgi:hypothetical protein